MPGGVRSRQPWLYLGADWAASDILGPEREAGDGGKSGWVLGDRERGERRREEEEVKSKGRSVSGRAER